MKNKCKFFFFRTAPIFFLCLALFSSLGFSAQENISPDSFFQKAMDYRKEGKLREAEWSLKKALELEPENPDFHFELANIYASHYDEAPKSKRQNDLPLESLVNSARELEQALMLRPDFLQARFNLGVVYKKQGRYEEAREEFKQVLLEHPELVNAHLQIGSIYEEQGFFDEAKDAYLKAQDLDFGNMSIKAALDELKRNREADHQRMLRDTSPARYGAFAQGFNYSPNSPAGKYEQERRLSNQSSAGFQQAIPYLSAWLVDQFMQLRANREATSN